MTKPTTRRPWWDRWTAPHPSVTGPQRARRVRLTAALLLVLIPAAVAYLAPVGPQPSPDEPREFVVVGAATLGLLVAYVLVRSPRPTPASWLLVLLPWIIVAHAWQETADASITYFALIPIILAGLVLSLRAAIGFAAFNILGTLLVVLDPLANGLQGEPGQLQVALFFLAIATPLVLLGAGFLERSARQTERANQQLREAERYRIQLLNVIAHDLASPLTPVQLQMRVLKQKVGDTKGFDILQRNIDHIQRLVGDVRDLSRLEMDRLRLDRRAADLAHLVDLAAQNLHQWAEAHQITPATEIDRPLPVLADTDRVNQVLFNLISNALKFTPPGKTVTVHATRHDGSARVSVQDEGRGIAPEDMDRLFKPFSQLHDRTEYKEKGTGLGLYIAKGIIEGHGGRIWAESAGPGRGATFSFELPLAAPPA